MKLSKSLVSAVTVSILIMAGSLWAQDVSEETHDGLKRVPNSKVSAAYVHPEADFSQYKKFIILDTFVAFKKNWEKEHRAAGSRMNVSKSEMDRIKRGLADLFREVFTEVLEEGGYEIVTASGEDVMILRPAIIDLDVTAPDIRSAGRSRNYVSSAGAMTLFIEMFDSDTSAILARAVDRKASRDTGIMQIASSVYNSSEARKILKTWATILRDRLDEIHSAAPAKQ